MSSFAKIIAKDEGFRANPYLCSEGFLTVGYGQKLSSKKGLNPVDYDFSMPPVVAEAWLERKLDDIIEGQINFNSHTQNAWRVVDGNQARQAVIVSMIYQLGFSGFLKFKKAIGAMIDGRFTLAASDMLDSRWANQTPERALRLAEMMRTGELDPYYAE